MYLLANVCLILHWIDKKISWNLQERCWDLGIVYIFRDFYALCSIGDYMALE